MGHVQGDEDMTKSEQFGQQVDPLDFNTLYHFHMLSLPKPHRGSTELLKNPKRSECDEYVHINFIS